MSKKIRLSEFPDECKLYNKPEFVFDSMNQDNALPLNLNMDAAYNKVFVNLKPDMLVFTNDNSRLMLTHVKEINRLDDAYDNSGIYNIVCENPTSDGGNNIYTILVQGNP